MTIRTGVKLAILGICLSVAAHADSLDPLWAAFGATKPLFDSRLRTETVDQEPIAESARAVTLRLRAGFETGKAWNTTMLAEGDGVIPLRDDYRPDPLTPVNAQYPVVADDEVYEINRLQLTNTSLPGTAITLGRQRILLDDQRFIGNSGWRQNEQTFDALRVVNKSVKNLVIDATYLNRVNRVNGPDSPQGVYKGDTGLVNVSYQTKVGKITAYGYLLDFDNIVAAPAAVRDSTATYGLRFAGEKPVGKVKLTWLASYATQSDYADNPLDFDVDYVAGEFGATFNQFNATAGVEIMEGNGVKGFTTPLASLHKFQGWADKFLATPANGIEDKYLNAGATFKAVGQIETLAAVVSYHDYAAERISADFGDELDLSLSAKYKKATLLLKYADFHEGDVALGSPRDTEKLWFQLEFVL